MTEIDDGEALKVTLLGTGGPPPMPDRFGPTSLVEAGGEKSLFDLWKTEPSHLALTPKDGFLSQPPQCYYGDLATVI